MKNDGRPARISSETAATASGIVIGVNGTPQTQTLGNVVGFDRPNSDVAACSIDQTSPDGR
jgi:hypothetical protein